jgi:tetratricopeptide (TPR) repeat protein
MHDAFGSQQGGTRMSHTLNLVDILLTTGRNLMAMGRFTEALEPLTKLSGFRCLPDHVVEELQALLGDIYLQQRRYTQARRHLAAAIALKPLKAEHHYLMAIAIEEDESADLKRAEMYFARAVRIDASEPSYWVDFGSYLFKIGKDNQALAALRKAFALAMSDSDIVGEVAAILRREGQFDEATTKLRAALFHNHGAQAFRLLWQHHQFHLIRADQEAKHTKATGTDKPAILPFVAGPRFGKFLELGKKTIRIDQAESLPEPKEKKPQPYRRPPKG